jgi:hypothetical protein
MRELKRVQTKPSILLLRSKADAQMKYSRETTSDTDAQIDAYIRDLNRTTVGGWVFQKFTTGIVSATALWEAVSGERSTMKREIVYHFDEQSILDELKIPKLRPTDLRRESPQLYESWVRSLGGGIVPLTVLDFFKRKPFQFNESYVRTRIASSPPPMRLDRAQAGLGI